MPDFTDTPSDYVIVTVEKSEPAQGAMIFSLSLGSRSDRSKAQVMRLR
jgi:hypothetical protein